MSNIKRIAELLRRQKMLLKALKKIGHVPLRGPADMREAYLEGRAIALDQCATIAFSALQEFEDDVLGKVSNPERMNEMSGSTESLARSLRTVAKYVNDHDYICKCRPADITAALDMIDLLRTDKETLIAGLRSICTAHAAGRISRVHDMAEIASATLKAVRYDESCC